MTPLMRRFTAVLARKRMAANWQFGAMPGSTAATPVFLARHRLQRGQEENDVLAFDVSQAFDTAPHSAMALLLRHMGQKQQCGGGHLALVCLRTTTFVLWHVFG